MAGAAWLPRVFRRFARPETGVVLGAALFALAAYQELFRLPFATGFGDTQFFHHDWELGRVAIARYHELPLWNPYACGGIPDWGDPQSELYHPLFFLSFVVGTTLALKLFIVAHAAAGLAGMYVYARRIEGMGVAAAALAAGAWAGSGYFAWHCGTGHVGFVAFYLTPWLLYCFRRALSDLRFAVGVACVLTLALLGGGANVFPYFLLLLGFDAVFRLWRADARRRVVLVLLTSGVLTLLAGAWRLIPVLEHMRYFPRLRDTEDSLGLAELVGLLGHAAPRTALNRPAPGHAYGYSEYGAYVGFGVVVVGVLGVLVVLAAKRERLALVAGAAAFGSLALGEFSRFSPWKLLHLLPVYGALQAPSRFLFAFLFFFTLLAGVALDEASRRLARFVRGRGRDVASLAVVAVLLVPVLENHRAVLAGRWQSPPVPRGPTSPSYHLYAVPARYGEPALLPPPPELPGQNLGTGYCYTGMGYRAARGLWAGNLPQVRVPEGGRAERFLRTTRTASLDVDIPGGGRVVFDQTWAPGWVSNFGTPFADAGRAAVEVPPGRHHVFMRYAPASVGWAFAASLLGVAACAMLVKKRVADALFASTTHTALGFGVLGLGVALSYSKGVLGGDPSSHPPLPAALAAEASDSEPARGAANAVDGKIASEWLAPRGKSAWLDVRLSPPRSVSGVALLNARNLPSADRGAKDLFIETYAGTKRIEATSTHFTRDDAAEWLDVPLGPARVDRIRITLEAWFGEGGGIAEVRPY